MHLAWGFIPKTIHQTVSRPEGTNAVMGQAKVAHATVFYTGEKPNKTFSEVLQNAHDALSESVANSFPIGIQRLLTGLQKQHAHFVLSTILSEC